MKKIEVFIRHCYKSSVESSEQNRPTWWKGKKEVLDNFKRTIKRTEGVSTTDIVGRLLTLSKDHFL
jgi:hypothetical protein